MPDYEISGLWHVSLAQDADPGPDSDEVSRWFMSFDPPDGWTSADGPYTPDAARVRALYGDLHRALKRHHVAGIPDAARDGLDSAQTAAAARFFVGRINRGPLPRKRPFELLRMLDFPLLYTAQYFTAGIAQPSCWVYTVDVLSWLKSAGDFVLRAEDVLAADSTRSIADVQSYLEYIEVSAYSQARAGGDLAPLVAEIADALGASAADAAADAAPRDARGDFLDTLFARAPAVPEAVPRAAAAEPPVAADPRVAAEHAELDAAAAALRAGTHAKKTDLGNLTTILAVSADVPNEGVRELLDALAALRARQQQQQPPAPSPRLAQARAAAESLAATLQRLQLVPALMAGGEAALAALAEQLPVAARAVTAALADADAAAAETAARLAAAQTAARAHDSEIAQLRAEQRADPEALRAERIELQAGTERLRVEIASLEYRKLAHMKRKAAEIRAAGQRRDALTALLARSEALREARDALQRRVEAQLPRKRQCEAVCARHAAASAALARASARVATANESVTRLCDAHERVVQRAEAVLPRARAGDDA